jgi:hypothetical protein
MTDEMDGATGFSNDRLQRAHFVGNARVANTAALGTSTISEQARRHAAKLVIPGADHGAPRGAGTARPRHKYYRGADATLFIIDVAACFCDHE